MGGWGKLGNAFYKYREHCVSTSKHRAEKGTESTCASCSVQLFSPFSTCFNEIALPHPHCRDFYEFNTMLTNIDNLAHIT